MKIETDRAHERAVKRLSELMDETETLSKEIEAYESERWPFEEPDYSDPKECRSAFDVLNGEVKDLSRRRTEEYKKLTVEMGRVMRVYRESKNVALEEAARKQKVTPDTLRIWESGLKRYSPQHAHRLIHFLS